MENEKHPIQELIEQLRGLKEDDKQGIRIYLARVEMVLRKLEVRSPHYVNILNSHLLDGDLVSALDWDSFTNAKRRVQGILEIALEEHQRFSTKAARTEGRKVEFSKRVFLVHGHDGEMKSSVAKTLIQLGLIPVILHEQPDEGRAIIEKLEAYSDVGFAVVLISPDDKGCPSDGLQELKPRARQNVILELGLFIGKLGRKRVLVIYREQEGFEFPSDYSGVIYKPFDKPGKWEFEIVKELQAAGYAVSADMLTKRQDR